MNRKLIYSITTSLLLLIIVIATLLFRDTIFINPFNRNMRIELPSFATADAESNVYIIDHSLRRIVKTNSDQDALFSIQGGSRKKGSFYNATELTTDAEDRIYVLNRVPDEDGFFTVREEVIRYKADGSFDTVIFSRIYSDSQLRSQLVQRSQLSSLHKEDNFIVWFDIAFDGVHIYTYNILSESIDFRLALPLRDANITIASIAHVKQEMYYITKQGRVIKQTGKTSQVIFDGNLISEKGFPVVPWKIVASKKSEIYISNIVAGEIYQLPSHDYSSYRPILDQDVLRHNGKPADYHSYYSLSLGQNGLLYTCQEKKVIGITNQAKIKFYADSVIRPITYVIGHTAILLLYAALVIASILMLRLFYIYTLDRKISLIIKHIVIFVPLVVAALILTAQLVYYNMISRFQVELLDKLSMMVQLVPQMVDAEKIKGIKNQHDFMSSDYQQVRASLHKALNDNQDSWNSGYYFALHKPVNGKLFSLMWLNDEITTIHPFAYLNSPEGVYTQAARGDIVTEKSADAWGLWMDAIGPIYDSQGNIVALLEIGKDYVNFAQENERLFKKVMINVAIISLIFMIIFITISYLMLISIRKLSNGAALIAKGTWDVEIKARGNDEVSQLTHSFNEMARSIKAHVSEVVNLNKAYHRFVPEQFLQFLSKESIMDISLGDQIQENMSVMFSDIRSFTTLSEKMTPRENFNFLNNYLGAVGPIVRHNEGFIDKYIGDAVMALFPKSPDNAVDAAIGISRKIDDLNKQRLLEELTPIAAGFGIHTGMLMLGILGEEQRVDSTVISDNVNLASRLEGLTKKFGASIIISQDTIDGLINRERYTLRFLGQVQVKGKSNTIEIYEVLDALSEDEKVIKIETKKIFEEGIGYLLNQQLAKAYTNFKKAYRIDNSDLAIQFYIKLCRQFEKYPERLKNGIILNEK